jgi:hypothetical protein
MIKSVDIYVFSIIHHWSLNLAGNLENIISRYMNVS